MNTNVFVDIIIACLSLFLVAGCQDTLSTDISSDDDNICVERFSHAGKLQVECKLEAARKEYLNILESCGDDDATRHSLAITYYLLGEHDKAYREYETLISSAKKFGDKVVADGLLDELRKLESLESSGHKSPCEAPK